MITKPMSVRRSEFIKIKQDEAENAPSFLRRVMSQARAADIRSMTQEEHVLLMFGMNLCKSEISNTIRTAVFDYLQKNKSIDNLNSIISTVEQIQSNFTSTQRVTSNSNNVRRTREENGFKSDEWGRECRLCESRQILLQALSYARQPQKF